MQFWAIADAHGYEEHLFYNVKTGENHDMISEECLLPSKELAYEIIEEHLGADFSPVAIELEVLYKNGDFSWSLKNFDAWED